MKPGTGAAINNKGATFPCHLKADADRLHTLSSPQFYQPRNSYHKEQNAGHQFELNFRHSFELAVQEKRRERNGDDGQARTGNDPRPLAGRGTDRNDNQQNLESLDEGTLSRGKRRR